MLGIHGPHLRDNCSPWPTRRNSRGTSQLVASPGVSGREGREACAPTKLLRRESGPKGTPMGGFISTSSNKQDTQDKGLRRSALLKGQPLPWTSSPGEQAILQCMTCGYYLHFFQGRWTEQIAFVHKGQQPPEPEGISSHANPITWGKKPGYFQERGKSKKATPQLVSAPLPPGPHGGVPSKAISGTEGTCVHLVSEKGVGWKSQPTLLPHEAWTHAHAQKLVRK